MRVITIKPMNGTNPLDFNGCEFRFIQHKINTNIMNKMFMVRSVILMIVSTSIWACGKRGRIVLIGVYD